jgi:sugar phosphate isomerase/epimerase
VNKLSRRSFLTSASTFAGAGWLMTRVRPAIAIERFDHPQWSEFPIGVQSYSLRNFDLTTTVRHIRELGLHFAEFYSKHLPLDASPERINETLSLLKGADIRLVAHGVNEFTHDHAANRQVFEFARQAGIRNITANPQPDSFDSLDQLCDEFDIRICIHNHGPGALYDKIADVARAVKNRHPHVGACIDTGHFIRSAEDPVQAVYELRGRLFALHVKDEAFQRADSHNVVIGTGHLDLVGLFTALRETGFPRDGSISLEYEANPDNPIEDIRECIAQAQRAIAQLPPAPSQSAATGQASAPCDCQPSSACRCRPLWRRRRCR